jgi:hypothetical protein
VTALASNSNPAVSAIGFLISSFLFGALTWFAGLLASYIYFGTFWTVIAFFFFGVGVVPLGMIGAAFHADRMAGWLLLGGLVLTLGTRATGGWLTKFESDLRNPAVIGGASSFSPLNISIDVKPIDRVQHFAAAVPIELSEQRDDLFDDGVGFRGWLRLGVVRLKVVFGLGFLSPTDRQRSLGAASFFR